MEAIETVIDEGVAGQEATGVQVQELVELVVRRAEERRARPLATYRVQLTGQFTLHQAADLTGYLSDLGATHLYAAPYLKAQPGSGHGYDVCDHGEINPELGGAAGQAALSVALLGARLGHVADFVPNHMSASSHNPWWMDVLENGPSSPYSSYFDIDWLPMKDELAYKVLLPILGQQYGEVLESGQLELMHAEGAFFLRYFEHVLPIAPKTLMPLLMHRLDELRRALGPASDECAECESIITAIENLPEQTDTSPESIQTRQREKEVIKRRLRALEARSNVVAEFVARNISEFAGRPGDPASFDRLDQLLRSQPYRLCHWRAASDEINYRRFFDINELAALSMESPQVFRRSHSLIGRLLGSGAIDGLRIDHIDGLLAPEQYLWRLQWLYLAELALTAFGERAPEEAVPLADEWNAVAAEVVRGACARLGLPEPQGTDLAAVLGEEAARSADGEQNGRSNDRGLAAPNHSHAGTPPLYVVVEKILGPEEPLPESWPTAGTTGYDFLKALVGLFIDDDGWREIQRVYQRFVEEEIDFEEVAYESKQAILRFAMASELQMLAHRLNRISEQHRRTRDFTLNMLRHALRDILACFPVYRTYASAAGVSDRDRHFVQLAIARAKRRNPAIDSAVFDFIRRVLLLEHPEGLSGRAIAEREAFAGRFQQVTSPVMAKGVEDTAFYVYCPLLSANEVGGDPRRPTCSLADFHRENGERQSKYPLSLVATSTHDTKRSEDVRSRISVLAEFPGWWKQVVNRWARLNRRHKQEVDGLPAPSRNDEYVLYQSLVGVWPLAPAGAEELKSLTERVQQYMQKVGHESKQRTSWINPNAAYDQAVNSFVAEILKPGRRNRFLADLQRFHEQVVDYGLYSAISQTALKLTSPGVPDIFQGQELWDFSLVDPDSRRPVNYEQRRWLLGEMQAAAAEREGLKRLASELAVRPRDSRLKMFVTWRLLSLRQRYPEIFLAGEYWPLEVKGAEQQHVVAFARRVSTDAEGERVLVVVVPRLIGQLLERRTWEDGQQRSPMGQPVWGETEVAVPWPLSGQMKNVLTGEVVEVGGGRIRVAEALAQFPAAVLVNA